jgi:hypothetical protein
VYRTWYSSGMTKTTPEFGITTRPIRIATEPGRPFLTLAQGTAVIVTRRSDDAETIYIERDSHTALVEATAVRPLA